MFVFGLLNSVHCETWWLIYSKHCQFCQSLAKYVKICGFFFYIIKFCLSVFFFLFRTWRMFWPTSSPKNRPGSRTSSSNTAKLTLARLLLTWWVTAEKRKRDALSCFPVLILPPCRVQKEGLTLQKKQSISCEKQKAVATRVLRVCWVCTCVQSTHTRLVLWTGLWRHEGNEGSGVRDLRVGSWWGQLCDSGVMC